MLSLYWVGSNKPIGPPVQCLPRKAFDSAMNKAVWLQRTVARCIDAKPHNVKVLLGSANGPPLTPRLRTVNEALWNYRTNAAEAVKKAWIELEAAPNDVLNVYVTQHSAADVAVDELARWYSYEDTDDVVAAYNEMSDALRKNPKVAIAALKFSSGFVRIPAALSSNEQFVVHLAKELNHHVVALKHAHPDLRNDKQLVLAVLAFNAASARHVPRKMLDDKDVVLALVRKHGAYFANFASSFKDDREVVLAAVSSWGYALQYVLPCFQDDKEVVLAALRAQPKNYRNTVLQFASLNLQNDRDVLAMIVSPP